MWLFHNDYNQLTHPKIMERMQKAMDLQFTGYGEDEVCASAAAKIRKACGREDVAVHFLVGGTQTNLTVISATLRPHQGVLGAESAHINTHETGAIEATGHKVIGLPSKDGKITPEQISHAVLSLREDGMPTEHMVQPKMVYISNPTELGTIYYKEELEQIHQVCRKLGLYLFVDGARLGYGLTAEDNDITLADMANLCDVFYIGGTKVGAMIGEAVVITNPAIAEDFRYLIKQKGAMLAKGWILGIQFDVLFTDDLYFEISRHANICARKIRDTLDACNVEYLVPTSTNQIFPILSEEVLAELGKEFTYSDTERISPQYKAIRFCTSWATEMQAVDALCDKLKQLLA